MTETRKLEQCVELPVFRFQAALAKGGRPHVTRDRGHGSASSSDSLASLRVQRETFEEYVILPHMGPCPVS